MGTSFRELRFNLFDSRFVAIMTNFDPRYETHVHGLMKEPILRSRFLCGIRASSSQYNVVEGNRSDITCRQCLDVLEKYS
jgi:hypothetical protein